MLAICGGLITRPMVFPIGETSAGLSPLVVNAIVDALIQLRGRRRTILLVDQGPH